MCIAAAGAATPAAGRAATPAPAQAAPGPPTWSDEFEGDALDTTKWSHRATGPRHDGTLTRDAVSVSDGILTIKTYTEGGTHYSGMISTDPRGSAGFEQTYGRFEARMRFHSSPGQWSAFWLQSPTIGHPLGEPAQAGVEMDVAEHRVRCPESAAQQACGSDADVSDRVQQGLIWDGYGDDRRTRVSLSDALTGLGNDSWHTWGVTWTPTQVTFTYDGNVTWSLPGPISRRAQYIVLSSEVGEFFAGSIPAGGYGSRETSTTKLEVDWVRAWDAAPAPASVRAPVISGPPRVGGELACSSGEWSGDPAPALTYEWLSDGVPIGGAAAPAYVVTGGDRGHALACRVSAANAAGLAHALSNALMVPAAPQKVAPTVAVTIACSVCRASVVSARAFGSVRVPRVGRAKARRYTPRASATTSAGGKTVRIAVRLVRRTRGAIIRALLAGRRIVVTFGVRVRDSDGKTGTITRQVPLRL